MKAAFMKVSVMARAFIPGRRAVPIAASGRMMSAMAAEYLPGLMVIALKVNFAITNVITAPISQEVAGYTNVDWVSVDRF